MRSAIRWHARKRAVSAEQTEPGGSRRAGAVSAIELLMVILIMSVVAVGVSKAIGAALALSQMYREDAAVREWLCTQFKVLEPRLSMAEDVNEDGLTNGVYYASYRLETAGACLETNKVVRVTKATFTADNDGFLCSPLTTADPRHIDTIWTPREPSEGAGCPAGSRLTSVEIMGAGVVRRVALTAEYPRKTVSGTVEPGTVTVERAVRLWNSIEW